MQSRESLDLPDFRGLYVREAAAAAADDDDAIHAGRCGVIDFHSCLSVYLCGILYWIKRLPEIRIDEKLYMNSRGNANGDKIYYENRP